MHDELSQLERRLEQATSRGPVPEPPLDPEAASLREGWRVLAGLLAAADAVAPGPTPLPATPPCAKRRLWVALAVAALAASLLVGAVVAWKVVGDKTPDRNIAKVLPPAKTQKQKTQPAATAKQQNPTPAAPVAVPAWDDSLDESIAQARQELIRVQQDWHAIGGASLPVSTRLEEIEQELNKSTI